VRIGTRGSALALWQANTVADLLRARGAEIEIVPITTTGDRQQEAPLTAISSKGVFTKEIEDALLREDIDIAVHSAKDMAAVLPPGLAIAAVLPREDPRDALVLPSSAPVAPAFRPAVETLGDAPRIGTSSPRRVAQLRILVPRAQFTAIRGNVDTRLRKLDAGEADALILAAAGLRRLGLAHRISAYIPVEQCMPAPGQGIVAIQVRRSDERTYAQVSAIDDPMARLALTAEQAVVEALGGGCQLPLGALAEIRGHELVLRGVAASLDGQHTVAAVARTADLTDAAGMGRRLADDLIARGARTILTA
jgi:hydroxymethylbilane synthase